MAIFPILIDEREVGMNTIKAQLIDDLSSINQKKKRSSKLDPFKYEILILRQFDMSYKKIANWLHKEKSLNVSPRGIRHMVVNVWESLGDV